MVRNARHDRSARRAFTLVELLAVMAIITILAGGLVGGAFAVVRHTKHKNTENLLEQLTNGLHVYHDDHRQYPPGNASDNTQPLYEALQEDGNYVEVSGANKVDYDDDPDVTDWRYEDAWGTELRYVCEYPHDSYELSSAGPDKVWGSDDDVTKE